LPKLCQVAPVNDMLIDDFDKDGKPDILLVGNDFSAESNYGRFDALTGLLLKSGNNQFEVVPSRKSGFHVPFQSNHIIEILDKDGKKLILATQNNKEIRIFSIDNE